MSIDLKQLLSALSRALGYTLMLPCMACSILKYKIGLLVAPLYKFVNNLTNKWLITDDQVDAMLREEQFRGILELAATKL